MRLHERSAPLRAALLLGAATASIMLTSPAIGQTAAAPPVPAPETVPADNTIGDIIVTANRREERNQDVPIAITAIAPERLQQQGIAREQDLAANVPSLVVGPNGQGSRDSQSFTIRGQGATFQASPGVVVYLNEVPLPSALTVSQQGGPGNFLDLESLQVLSGPQGTLFGRNTTGGAVLLVPRKPTDTLSGWIQGTIGNYDRREVEGAINLPIVSDKLMIRVAGAFHDRTGYTYDVIWNKDRDNEHYGTGRLGILFKPVDGVTNYTMAYGTKSDTNGTGLIHKGFNIPALSSLGLCVNSPLAGGFSCDVYRANTARADALGSRRTAFSTDVFQQTETWGVTNTTDVDLTEGLTLRNIVAYQRMRIRYRYDADATALQQHDVDPGVLPGTIDVPGLGPTTYANATLGREGPRDNLRVWTEELQLQGNMLDNKFNWTVGGFYFDQRPAGLQRANALLYCPAGLTGSAAVCQASFAEYGTTTTSKAVYAQATLDFGALSPSLDGLRLTGGYRHTWDKIAGFATQYNFSSLLPAGLVVCGKDSTLVVPVASAVASCLFAGTQKSNTPSWLVGLDYKVMRDVLLYAKVSRGYKAGGFNPYAVFFGQNGDPDTRTFGPETVTSYEAGFKSDFRVADIPFRLNTSVYTLTYDGIQRATGDYNVTTNAGGARTLNADARIRGIEVEASVRPFRGIEIGGNFSYTDAKYKRYTYVSSSGTQACNGLVAPGGVADSSCLPFQYVSPYIWSAHVSAERKLGNEAGTLALFVNYAHNSSQYTEAVNIPAAQPGARLDAYGILNVSLDLRDIARSGIDAGIFATNLTNNTFRISNSDVFQAGGLLYWDTLYGEPRMYGLRVRYHFDR
ncbi:TonB-dependent receptor plug domain-containing protein [Sphingomonas sp. RP10(2022)]|uniref:TonB-dependent receptor plug domain-containing protein n=1 Tax=Sphingomonas liriopis TaxID=2949094 RepID=A0A9X2HYR2_9SPHN|nr:TonB-dependent receptor [Sphingomonas liriopis]MCP3735904.1 TonB-dependent receptor plug domain-containing protein [Sphingomonas liriopis]